MLQTNDKIVKHKVDLPNLADELGSISKVCKIMDVLIRFIAIKRR